jgi:trehalose utilization protein
VFNTPTRRDFLQSTTGIAAAGLVGAAARGADEPPVVVVWDERQPAQKPAYPDFLGNHLARELRTRTGLSVASAGLDDAGQGLTDVLADSCRVLVWWGHVRQAEVKSKVGRDILKRIKAGDLALIALHSAHWSTPFVEAMNERAREDLNRTHPLVRDGKAQVNLVYPNPQYTVPARGARLTPYVDEHKYPDGKVVVDLHLPICCFPAYRNDGKPSQIRTLTPNQPIARGVPAVFEIPREEMYDEPFHVPPPDEVVFEERWETGEWFRSGMLWKIGRGHVFYFRPGHESYSTYLEENPLKIVANAVTWLAKGSI